MLRFTVLCHHPIRTVPCPQCRKLGQASIDLHGERIFLYDVEDRGSGHRQDFHRKVIEASVGYGA